MAAVANRIAPPSHIATPAALRINSAMHQRRNIPYSSD
jgi:hypothetical protein